MTMMDAARSFLKPFVKDTYNDAPVPLFYHKRTVVDPEAQPDEFIVEEILDHKVDAKGDYSFLTHWRGYPREEATWEPPNHFIHRYATDLVLYCRRNNLSVDILKYLSDKPHEI